MSGHVRKVPPCPDMILNEKIMRNEKICHKSRKKISTAKFRRDDHFDVPDVWVTEFHVRTCLKGLAMSRYDFKCENYEKIKFRIQNRHFARSFARDSRREEHYQRYRLETSIWRNCRPAHLPKLSSTDVRDRPFSIFPHKWLRRLNAAAPG